MSSKTDDTGTEDRGESTEESRQFSELTPEELAQRIGCLYVAATIGPCGKPVGHGKRYCGEHCERRGETTQPDEGGLTGVASDASDQWNRCPKCKTPVDIEADTFEGADVRCRACRADLVLATVDEGTSKLVARAQYDADVEPLLPDGHPLAATGDAAELARPSPDRAAWLLHPVSAAGRATIHVSQYEELRREAVALSARVAELEAALAAAEGQLDAIGDAHHVSGDPDGPLVRWFALSDRQRRAIAGELYDDLRDVEHELEADTIEAWRALIGVAEMRRKG